MQNKSIDSDKINLNIKVVILSIIFILLYCALYFFFGERLQVNGGLGWDGIHYGAYAENFWSRLSIDHQPYTIKRIFPSFVVYIFQRIFKINVSTTSSIFELFFIYNSFLYLSCAYLWYRICLLKKFNTSVYLIGFFSFFLNLTFLKYYQFAPVHTDITAIFFGFLTLYCYLLKKYYLITFISLPIFFTWPIAVAFLLPLFILNSGIDDKLKSEKISRTIIFSAIAIYLLSMIYWLGLKREVSLTVNFAKISYYLLPFSLSIICAYIYFIINNSYADTLILNFRKIKYNKLLQYLLIMFLCVIAWKIVLSFTAVTSNDRSDFGITDYIKYIMLGSIAKPGLSIIANIIFWGPCALLWIVYIKQMVKAALDEGIGLYLFIIASLILSLDAESRHFSFNYPFMVYMVCSVFTKLKISNKFLLGYALASLITSKFYYKIGSFSAADEILEFPAQNFFMNVGSIMNMESYIINFVICLFISGIIWFSDKHLLKNKIL